MNRIRSLDYLRGLCAFGIMIYHYLLFYDFLLPAETFFGRIGIYGVSIFYILSGLTLFVVYFENFDLRQFFIRRVFRIFPLLWVTIVLTIILHNTNPGLKTLLLNFTGAFSVLKWNAYIGMGVWSIGNEIAFYLFFPIFILLSKNHKIYFLLLCFLIFAIYFWFAFFTLDSNTKLAEQWRNYVNPLNQVGLFLAGFLIGYLFRDYEVRPLMNFFILGISICLFIFLPIEGNGIKLVTDWNRVMFTLISAGICFSFFKMSMKEIPYIDTALKTLGEISYSIYLMHPIVWFGVIKILKRFNISIPMIPLIALCVFFSISISYILFNSFEKFFMNLGKKLTPMTVGLNSRK